jgi:hypothetical protein
MATGARGAESWASIRGMEAPRSSPPSGRPAWVTIVREVGFLAAAAFLYTFVRGLTDDRVDVAHANAEQVISLERSLGIFVEPDLQNQVVGHGWLVDVLNALYISYWPIVFGTLAWLLVRRRDMYPVFRNALLASGAITLVVFAAYPLAPPRFLPERGFVDTIAAQSEGYRSFNASALVNEYAAMPSLHFGWVLLVGIALVTLASHPALRVAGVAAPVLMLAAIVLTGNHYIVDGVVGGATVLTGLGLAHALRRRFRTDTGSDLW